MTKDQLLEEAERLLGFGYAECLRVGGACGQTVDNMMRARCGRCRPCRTRAWVDAYGALMASAPASDETKETP